MLPELAELVREHNDEFATVDGRFVSSPEGKALDYSNFRPATGGRPSRRSSAPPTTGFYGTSGSATCATPPSPTRSTAASASTSRPRQRGRATPRRSSTSPMRARRAPAMPSTSSTCRTTSPGDRGRAPAQVVLTRLARGSHCSAVRRPDQSCCRPSSSWTVSRHRGPAVSAMARIQIGRA